MTTTTSPADTRTLSQLIMARADLLDAEPSPAVTRQLNRIEDQLDLLPWRQVKEAIAAEDAYRAELKVAQAELRAEATREVA